jgi:hypothetical protein
MRREQNCARERCDSLSMLSANRADAKFLTLNHRHRDGARSTDGNLLRAIPDRAHRKSRCAHRQNRFIVLQT